LSTLIEDHRPRIEELASLSAKDSDPNFAEHYEKAKGGLIPNNRAAASPKRAFCRFEKLIGGQITEDKRKAQRMKLYRRPFP
jgi:hypothetical protein